MVGWIPKLIYTQTNTAIVFLFLWIKHLYCHWKELTVYCPTTLQELSNGCCDIFTFHWPLWAFIIELVICKCTIGGIKRNAPKLTIHASSVEKVSMFNVSSIFTIMPVLATLMTNKISLQLIFVLICLVIYEIIAFIFGCSNPTMAILGYKEYKIVSVDNMNHRILTQKKIRKGNDSYHVIEFNDIYIMV